MIIDIGNKKPTKKVIDLCKKHGKDDFSSYKETSFFSEFELDFYSIDAPNLKIMQKEKALVVKAKIVPPHDDLDMATLSNFSVFWLCFSSCFFKVTGSDAIDMKKGDWVIFDHTKEHMAFSDKTFGGISFLSYLYYEPNSKTNS